jgi:hypothetical protein
MRLFQRILALRLDWAECRNGCLQQAGADGVGIVALLGEKIGGPLLGQGDYLFECRAVRRFAG